METRRRAWLGIAIFAFCWLVVLTVRPLRNRWQVQLLNWDDNYSSVGPQAVLPPWLAIELRHLRPAVRLNFDLYRFSHPHDPRVLWVQTENDARRQWGPIFESTSYQVSQSDKNAKLKTGRGEPAVAAIKVYDQAIRRHPADGVLIAQRLRWSMESVYGPAAEDVSGYSPVPTSGQLQADLAVARLGSRVEPNNSFFDMCIAAMKLALHQQRQALGALHSAATKPRFDNHITDLRRARMLDIGGGWIPILAEDKESYWYAEISFLNWYNVFAERIHAAAPDLPADRDLMRLGALIRDSDGSVNNARHGVWLQDTAWPLDARAASGAGAKPIHTLMDRARAFAAYARRFGQPALGREAIAQAAVDRRDLMQADEYDAERARYSAQGDGLVRSDWTATGLLALVYTLVLWLFVLSALLRTARRRVQNVQTAGRQAIAPAVAWASGLLFIVLLTVLQPHWLPGSLREFGQNLIEVHHDESFNSIGGDYAALTLLRSTIQYGPIAWGIVFYWAVALWRRRHAPAAAGVNLGRLGTIDRVNFLLLVLVATVSFVLFTLHRGHRAEGYSIEQWPVVALMAVIGAATLISFALLMWHLLRASTTFISRQSALCFLAAAAMFLAVFGCAATGYAESCSLDLVTPVLIAISIFFVFQGVVLHLRRELQSGAAAAADGLYWRLQWFRSYLGASLVVASVAYLAVSVGAMPARRRSEAWLDRVIAQGELPVVRQMPTAPQPTPSAGTN